jgi:hypothetical protein
MNKSTIYWDDRNSQNKNKGRFTNITCTNLKKTSKITSILMYLKTEGVKTKYEIVTKVLKKIGTKHELRGYYSCMMTDLLDLGMVSYNVSDYTYELTVKGDNTLGEI